jgi:hypothetical protein
MLTTAISSIKFTKKHDGTAQGGSRDGPDGYGGVAWAIPASKAPKGSAGCPTSRHSDFYLSLENRCSPSMVESNG